MTSRPISFNLNTTSVDIKPFSFNHCLYSFIYLNTTSVDIKHKKNEAGNILYGNLNTTSVDIKQKIYHN